MSLFVFFFYYLYVNGSGSITSVGEERANLSAVFFTCNYVVSVWRGFLFLWVLGMGYVILLWHSLSLPLFFSNDAAHKMYAGSQIQRQGSSCMFLKANFPTSRDNICLYFLL